VSHPPLPDLEPIFPDLGPILRKSPADNIPRPGGTGEWTKRLTDGKLFMRGPSQPFAWVNVHDADNEFDQPLTGISGTIVDNPHPSSTDLWFTHPFGFDFEFLVAPDEDYFDLVGPSMEKSYQHATDAAHGPEFGLKVPGVIGMEMEQGLVPERYRPKRGDRVCLWGRLIIDAGHKDLHTEIHPPLLMASAAPAGSKQQGARGEPDATRVKIITRPFLVSQKFDHGGLFNHILVQLGEATANPFSRIDAHPKLLQKPFAGQNIIGFEIRPPTPRKHARDKLILESKITQRASVSITVFVAPHEDAVRVLIVLNDASYTPPPEPKKHDVDISVPDMHKSADEVILAVAAVFPEAALVVPTVAAVVAKGVRTHEYEPISERSSGHEASFTRQSLNQAAGSIPTNKDDGQPFPLYGTLKLEWDRFLAAFPDSETEVG
jgi:hypothetical protein